MDKIWLICNQCGYNIDILENEISYYDECILCKGKMILDLNRGKKLEEPIKLDNDHNAYDEPLGDNFPIIHKDVKKELNNQEQEIINSIRMIGEYSTWDMIEAISDARMRARYRLIFLKQGGKIPEREV
jgi:hypothetical protein